jgi:hypothetical protein
MKNTSCEIVFVIEEAPEGGWTAKALGEAIFTEADDMPSLRSQIVDAVRCHFPDSGERPQIIRLHQVKDELIQS